MTKNEKLLLQEAFGDIFAVRIMLKAQFSHDEFTHPIRNVGALIQALERAEGKITEVIELE